ncbi:hypothetical protein DSECCO2_427410 [anaerobic digester metagenome]
MKVYELISQLSRCPAGSEVFISDEFMNQIESDGSSRHSGRINCVLEPSADDIAIFLDGD